MVVSLIVKTNGYNSTILKFNLPLSILKICHSIQIALVTESGKSSTTARYPYRILP